MEEGKKLEKVEREYAEAIRRKAVYLSKVGGLEIERIELKRAQLRAKLISHTAEGLLNEVWRLQRRPEKYLIKTTLEEINSLIEWINKDKKLNFLGRELEKAFEWKGSFFGLGLIEWTNIGDTLNDMDFRMRRVLDLLGGILSIEINEDEEK